jgi:hypothetical protein
VRPNYGLSHRIALRMPGSFELSMSSPEMIAVRRAVRPILRSVGLPFAGTTTYGLESFPANWSWRCRTAPGKPGPALRRTDWEPRRVARLGSTACTSPSPRLICGESWHVVRCCSFRADGPTPSFLRPGPLVTGRGPRGPRAGHAGPSHRSTPRRGTARWPPPSPASGCRPGPGTPLRGVRAAPARTRRSADPGGR